MAELLKFNDRDFRKIFAVAQGFEDINRRRFALDAKWWEAHRDDRAAIDEQIERLDETADLQIDAFRRLVKTESDLIAAELLDLFLSDKGQFFDLLCDR